MKRVGGVARTTAAFVAAVAVMVLGCAGLRKPAWEQPPRPGRDAPVVQPGALHKAELDNGMEIFVLEDHRLPQVVLGVMVRRGAGIVPPEQGGLAGFTTEVMRRGAGARGALALAEATDSLGASLDLSSDWDGTSVSISGLSRDLPRLVEILADVTLRPRFDSAEIEKARAELLAALEQAKDDPGTLARWQLARTLYGDHPYGVPRSGTPETLAALKADDLRAFHRRIFVPNDAIFYASGDIDLDELLPQLGAAFGAWERGERAPEGPAPPPQVPSARRIVVVDQPELAQVRIAIAHEGIARTNPDRIAAGLMNLVLGGGGFSSRLMTTLRADRGLTYSVDSGFAMHRHPGPFYVSTYTRSSELRQVIDLTLAEIERVRDEPPTEQELRDAKALLVGRFALGLETSSAVMAALVDLELYGLPDDSLDTYRGRVRAVTTEDTARLARELLHPQRAAIVLVGPASTCVPQLEGLGPVEVVRY